MSLINDALKRAKQAHEKPTQPALPGAPLHTLQASRHNSNLLLMVIVVGFLFVVLIGVGLLILIRLGPAPKQTVVANESRPDTQPHMVASQPQTQSPARVPQPVAAKPMPTPPPVPPVPLYSADSSAPVIPFPEPTRPRITTATALATPPPTKSVAIKPVVPVIAKPTAPPAATFPTVRLQGILFQPPHAAAIINGRTLSVGDQIDKVTIIAISQTSATVVWNRQTNVLTMNR